MARIAVLSTNIAGRMNATFEMARKLTVAGHEVTVLSHRDPDDVPQEFFARYVSLQHRDDVGPPITPNRTRPGRLLALLRRLAGIRHVAARRAEQIDLLGPEAVAKLIGELSPDLAVVDMEMPVEIMAARATHIPVAVFSDMYSVWRCSGLPPLSSDIVPGRGLRGTRSWIAASWYPFLARKWAQRIRLRVTRVGLDRRSVLKGVAHRMGFSLDDHTSASHWLIPFVYPSIPTLTLNALEMEFPHEPPANVTYVGPQIGVHRAGDLRATPRAGDELIDVLARCSDDPARSLIYCSFGAFGSGGASILARVIEAIGVEERWELVVGLGGKAYEIPDRLPPNIHVYDWAPQLAVLQRADCAIHHAGTHSINECVRHQVPMLVYPDDKLDHKGNAARVAFHGLGVVGDLRDTADTVRRLVGSCLGSQDIRSSLDRMSAAFDEYETSDALERVVQALLVR